MRMDIHCRSAQALAEYLDSHPKVAWVNYPGLASSPNRELAAKLFGGRFGAILTFGLGSKEAAGRFVDSTRLAQNLASIGDSKTLVIHPASTIFREFSVEERAEMGVPADLIRVSVGVESTKDIIADFESALENV
jgi:O-acetylhomoserine (thiol)-lyase